jgi:hypothetical protein
MPNAMKIKLIIMLLSITSCSGYKLDKKDNPFYKYGIESVSVPMFYNYSNLAGLSSIFTRKFVELLSGFKNLEVYQSVRKDADSFFIGEISSPQLVRETLLRGDEQRAKSKVPVLSKERLNYNIPTETIFNLSLKIILLKRVKNDGDKVEHRLKIKDGKIFEVIFEEVIPISGGFGLIVNDKDSFDSHNVNFTNNLSLTKLTIDRAATGVVKNFKETILYAF